MIFIKKTVFISLIIILIILVAIDIGTGIWYWNRLNLKFDSTQFNNIATPIVSIVSFIIIFFTLLVSMRQNSINLSLSIKSYFERKIDLLLDEAKNTKLNDAIVANLFPNENYNGINYVNSIVKSIKLLERNEQFKDDYREFKELGNSRDREYYKERDYYKIVLYLNQFTLSFNDFGSLYNQIQNLFVEINTSKLISEDKYFLQRRIKAEILQDYLSFIEKEKKYKIHEYEIPIMDEIPKPITYKYFHETEFAALYNWIKKNVA